MQNFELTREAGDDLIKMFKESTRFLETLVDKIVCAGERLNLIDFLGNLQFHIKQVSSTLCIIFPDNYL